ncbi:MAG: hypothetical protein Q9164_006004 [Protoblastenia rupestris]
MDTMPTLSSQTGSFSNTISTSPLATTTGSAKNSEEGTTGMGAFLASTALAITALIIWLWRQALKREQPKFVDPRKKPLEREREQAAAFLQQKPELQGEASRHEMAAEERRFELHAENRHEILNEDDRQGIGEAKSKQELRGEEAASQLIGDERQVNEMLLKTACVLCGRSAQSCRVRHGPLLGWRVN